MVTRQTLFDSVVEHLRAQASTSENGLTNGKDPEGRRILDWGINGKRSPAAFVFDAFGGKVIVEHLSLVYDLNNVHGLILEWWEDNFRELAKDRGLTYSEMDPMCRLAAMVSIKRYRDYNAYYGGVYIAHRADYIQMIPTYVDADE